MNLCPAEILNHYASRSAADLMDAVCMFADQFEPGEMGYGRPDEFDWAVTPAFPLKRLAGSRKAWVRWAAAEKAAWVEDYAPEPHEEMEYYWLPEPWGSPVIVVEGTDRRFYVWDGNHRVGVAFTAGLGFVPAIVGFRRASQVTERKRHNYNSTGQSLAPVMLSKAKHL